MASSQKPDQPLDYPGFAKNALILVPTEAGRVQDLGPHLSGFRMMTDILPGSAILAPVNEAGELHVVDGRIHFAFEGNLYNAVNLNSFQGKLSCAASRMRQNYPSIAYGSAAPSDLMIVGVYDLDRLVIEMVSHMERLRAWTGLAKDELLPPRVPSGTDSTTPDGQAMIARLLKPEGRTLMCPPMVYQLANGQVFFQREQNGPQWIYDHDDARLRTALIEINAPEDVVLRACGRDALKNREQDTDPGPGFML